MRSSISCLLLCAVAGLLTSGCAQTEKKLGRGLANTFEAVRWGELRRSVEQTAYLDDPITANTVGVVRGFNRSLTRIGVGVYEIVTAPLPPYTPVLTNYISAKPSYPDSYRPRRIADPLFDHDTSLGFAVGDNAAFVPGSRFNVFR
jgi:putative exosortase-associated protein (TIGR04073 family)